MEVNYIRRSWGNLTATSQPRVDAGRLRHVHLQRAARSQAARAAADTRLTFRDIKPGAYTRAADNFLTFTDNIGGASNKYNGVDVTVNARLRDVTIQGGTSTGNVVEDSCGVVARTPRYYIFGPVGRHGRTSSTRSPAGSASGRRRSATASRDGRRTSRGWRRYTVPKIDVLLSGTFRSVPYPGNDFPSVQSQSLGGAGAGRSTSLASSTNLAEPAVRLGTGRRVPQHRRARQAVRRSLERRATCASARSCGTGSTRTLLTSTSSTCSTRTRPMCTSELTAPTWISNPLSIMSARFFKISAQFDF